MATEQTPIHEVRPTTQELKIPARFIALRVVGGIEYAAADDLSGSDQESESGDQRMREKFQISNFKLKTRNWFSFSIFHLKFEILNF
jgi:hypothetical protein